MERSPYFALAALTTLLLAACSGGSSNSPDPTPAPAAPQLADDAFSAQTGRDQLLDVLANDRDPAGGLLTLVSVTGQGQAALAIDGNRVRYRPRCCDLSADEFRYTARTAAGGTATAVVRVTVDRRLILRGSVADLGNNYSLRLYDGATAGEPRRESTAEFTLDLPFRTDNALLRLEARRTDAAGTPSARDILQSVLGGGTSLAQAAGADGELSASEWEPLRVASLTTAWLGWLREKNGGELPLDAARWATLQAQPIDVEEVLTRAQLVKAALDDAALVLPGPDTFALASSGPQSAVLLATQWSGFTTLDRSSLFGLTSRGPFPAPPATLWLYRGGFAQDEVATRLELNNGGDGRAVGPYGASTISWSTAGGVLTVEQAPLGAIPAHPAPLMFGSHVRRGFACGGNPVAPVEDRVRVARFGVRTLALRNPGVTPLATVVDYEGLEVSGNSVSSCATLFTPHTLHPGIGLIAAEQPRGANLPEGPLNGAWILPRCGPSCATASPDARPVRAGRTSLDANRQGRGLFEEDSGVVSGSRVEAGVVRLAYTDGEAQAYPVAGDDGAYRVVAAFPTADGVGVVSEGWMVQEDTSLRLATLWQGRTLRDCCRAGGVFDLKLEANGSFSGLSLASTRYELDGRRVVLELAASGPSGPRRVSFTALRRLADGRVLLLTRFDDDLITELDDELPVVDLVRFE